MDLPGEPLTDQLDHLDVRPVRMADGTVRVVVDDPRCGLRLASLTPADAAHLAGSLVVASARARGAVAHDPGE